MDKNEFDFDVDFEKEYGFDPNAFLDAEDGGDFDFSQFLDPDMQVPSEPVMDPGATQYAETEMDYADQEMDDLMGDMEEDFTAGIPFRRKSATAQEPEYPAYGESDGYAGYDEDMPAEYDDLSGDETAEPDMYDDMVDDMGGDPEEDDGLIDDGDELIDDGEEYAEEAASGKGRKKPRRKREPRPKSDKPTILSKFLDYYLAPLKENAAPEVDPITGRPRRRRKTKAQIFKEVYLPAIIAGVALILILVFIVGSVSNAFKLKKIRDANAENEAISASNAVQMAEQEYTKIIREAEELATGYDYKGAIERLESYTGDSAEHQQEITSKKAQYVNIQSQLQEWKDVSMIPNLSFHVLIADPSRAFSDAELGGKYNRNFVTTDEFSRILEQLYNGGYVLVDFDSCISSTVGLDNSKSFFVEPIYLPDGKKPVMITETMVNYFDYMIDSNRDGTPDAGGAGFASRLVVDGNGDIKAEMCDVNNQTQVGNFDLVPILEDFIKEHPDFSYRGARATLALTGSQGIFGYRINTSYVATMGAAYQEKEIADAKVVVQALRDKGYTMACFTYGNIAYRGKSVTQIQSDIQEWNTQIKPVLGDTEILIFAQTSDIDDYSGPAYQKLHENGFNIFVNNGTEPKADVNASFVRQTRLMVTGNAMGWYSSQFKNLFDCNVVLDMTSRKQIPNG